MEGKPVNPGHDDAIQEQIQQLVAQREERLRQAAPFNAGAAELWSLTHNPAAVALVRARTRGQANEIPRMPLYCSGHDTTHRLALSVVDETGEGQPVEPVIQMDIQAGPTGSAQQPPLSGGAWTFECGKCGRRSTAKEAKLFTAALKALGTGDTRRIKIT